MDDEEEQRLDRLLGALAARDEVQQRAEAVTKLQVSAWHCRTCGTTTERRRPACQVPRIAALPHPSLTPYLRCIYH